MKTKFRALPDQALLLHLFSYEAEIGRLFWRNPRATNKRPGDEAGCEYVNGSTSYRIVNIAKELFLTHRIIWVMVHGEIDDSAIIDHIDQNGLNNRIDNLRIVDRQVNGWNSKLRKDNASGVKGVSFDSSRGKWLANMHVRGRCLFFGRFDDFEDAVAARTKGAAAVQCR